MRTPKIRAIPPAHIEKAERKQSQAGVFIAAAQVLRLLNFGHPWRMNTSPVNTRSKSKPPAAGPVGAAGRIRETRSNEQDAFTER